MKNEKFLNFLLLVLAPELHMLRLIYTSFFPQNIEKNPEIHGILVEHSVIILFVVGLLYTLFGLCVIHVTHFYGMSNTLFLNDVSKISYVYMSVMLMKSVFMYKKINEM